ncbi:hypothetical protein GC176_04670 [bacterium]|nr:hypothetical protein [bacterium]
MRHSQARPIVRRLLLLCLAALLPAQAGGCSLFVMAGKMFFGDPKIKSVFNAQTGVDLMDGEQTILIVCRTPSLMQNQLPTLQHDLSDGILRRLKQQGIRIVSPDAVADWLDDNGGEFDNVAELAADFDTDYIAVIDVESLEFFEPNSPEMYRGKAQGAVRAYRVEKRGGRRGALQVFSGGFNTEYPRFSPVPAHSISERVFQKQFVDHLSQDLARQFYDYRMGDEF